MKTKLTLVLEVDYTHAKKEALNEGHEHLWQIVDQAIANGLLTGDSSEDLATEDWRYEVLTGQLAVLNARQRHELVKLLDYCQEAEQRHYEEMQEELGTADPACKQHIWHTVKRLAKVIGHEL